MAEQRQYERIKARAILVSLSNKTQQVTGFLRDISEGGLKIQKISADRQITTGNYECQFVLPDYGKIITTVEVLGAGDSEEKFRQLLIRARFLNLTPEANEKIKNFIQKNVLS